jgi:hypothetical protein
VLFAFRVWIEKNAHASVVFISGNPAFDWQFFHYLTGNDPFRDSDRRTGDSGAGLEKHFFAASYWKESVRART